MLITLSVLGRCLFCKHFSPLFCVFFFSAGGMGSGSVGRERPYV